MHPRVGDQVGNGRFGSLAALDPDITLTAASGGNPAVQSTDFENQTLSVCFHRKRSFSSPEIHENEEQLTARSGHRDCGS